MQNEMPETGEPAPHDSADESPAENADTQAEMTPEQLAEARRYDRIGLYCTLADWAIDLTFLGCMAFLFARPLDAALEDFPLLENRWLRLAAFFIAMTLLHIVVSFPLSFYSDHVVEHQFKLSNLTFTKWLKRYSLKNGLAILIGVFLAEILFGLIWYTGSWWWVTAAFAFFVAIIVGGYLLPVLIMPLFYKVERIDDQPLLKRLVRLAEGTSLKIEGIYRFDMSIETKKANAMLAGLGNTRRAILGDTLLESFTPDEIEVVFAHEVGHHVHKHIFQLVGLVFLFTIVSFFLCDRALNAWSGGVVNYAELPVSAYAFLTFGITIMSILMQPIPNTLSRFFERQCDRYALRRTDRPEAFRSAFNKLARQNKADPDPHPLEVFLLDDHPAIKDRLALADEYEAMRKSQQA